MFNLYVVETGELISSSADTIINTNPDWAVKETTASTGIWNTTTLDFDPYPPETRLDTGVFFDRWTQPELEALITAARTGAGPAVFLKRLDLKATVDRVDPLLITDMNRMVLGGILTVARKDEILSV